MICTLRKARESTATESAPLHYPGKLILKILCKRSAALTRTISAIYLLLYYATATPPTILLKYPEILDLENLSIIIRLYMYGTYV